MHCDVVRFLASFLIDARGGTVQGSRHAGVRVIIPPGRVCMPTRITCKLVRGDKLAHPPPLKEGEAIVSRGLELGPISFQFNGFVPLPCQSFTNVINNNKKLSCCRETERRFVSLNISLSHRRSLKVFEMTPLSRAYVTLH